MAKCLHVGVLAHLCRRAVQEELIFWHDEAARPLRHFDADLRVHLGVHGKGLLSELPRASLADEVTPEAGQPTVHRPLLPQRPTKVLARHQHLAAMEAQVAHAPARWQRLHHSVQLFIEAFADARDVVLQNQCPAPIAFHERLPGFAVRECAPATAQCQVRGALQRRGSNGGPLLFLRALCCVRRRACEKSVGDQLLPVELCPIHSRHTLQGGPEPCVRSCQLLNALPTVRAAVQVDEEAEAVLEPRRHMDWGGLGLRSALGLDAGLARVRCVPWLGSDDGPRVCALRFACCRIALLLLDSGLAPALGFDASIIRRIAERPGFVRSRSRVHWFWRWRPRRL
mmetsp:Transcript_54/g.105  ORF Transcript_54/g.105 Transcript_54/m.105 type:complete len:341 (-) Transcript_54:1039-2061(-)